MRPIGTYGVIAAVLLAGGLTIPAASAGQSAHHVKPLADVLDHPVSGSVALDRFAGRVDELAHRNGYGQAAFREILASDATSRIDQDARLFYVDKTAPKSTWTTPRASLGKKIELATDAFQLHSRAGSHRVIYLDFTGYTLTGTAWNASKGIDPVYITPYDTDGSPSTFSTTEQAVVREVWARVAEDYAPFDVDVTTQDPARPRSTAAAATTSTTATGS